MLRVMTLNLNYYADKHGAWPARRDIIQRLIRTHAPDVIALQAVAADPGVSEGLDQAHQIAAVSPEYRYVFFQPAVTHPNGIAQGSAFVSRLPLDVTDCLPLTLRPGLEDTNLRVVLRARLDLEGSQMYLFNAHFSWVFGQAQDNLAESLPFMNSVEGRALLVGDLNTIPTGELWGPLREAGWKDLWDELHPGEDGYTYESDRPYMRIDYAWANPALADGATDMKLIHIDRNSVRQSDHAGLMVTLGV